MLFALAATAQAADYHAGCSACGSGSDYAVAYDYGTGPVESNYFISDADFSKADPNANFVLRGSVGIASIEGREHVFASPTSNNDTNTSLLIWNSTAPIASIDVKLRAPGDWTVRGHVDAAIGGDSGMADYDWTGTYFAGYAFDNWTHRSLSPDTNLDWYLNGEVAVGRDLPISDAFTVNFNGGLKYTDVQWTASGGSFIYSWTGYRANTGTFTSGPVGAYRMQLPTAFVGVDADVADGPWTLAATMRAGMTFMAGDIDHHYLTDTLYYDSLNYAGVYSVNAKLGYNFSDHFGAFLEGSYEKMISGHGDTDQYTMSTHTLNSSYGGLAGGELQVATLKVGLKGNF